VEMGEMFDIKKQVVENIVRLSLEGKRASS
jgi:hypothetical protein